MIIERWTNADGQTDYRWSVWMAGTACIWSLTPKETLTNAKRMRWIFAGACLVKSESNYSTLDSQMTAEIDIWRSTNLLIKQHGKDAALEAVQRADALSAKGDMEGCRVWKRIVRAIEELGRTERKAAESLN